MFNILRGKGDKSDKASKDAPDTRGLEVREEDDPDTAWGLWDSALAEQDSRFSASGPQSKAEGTTGASDAGAPRTPAPAVVPVKVASAASASPTPVPTDALPAFGKLQFPAASPEEVPTQPLALNEKSLEQRKNDALDKVELHHHRIANTIRSMWGYKECAMYIHKLIMDGDDGRGHGRAGFNQEAVVAMLALADIHDAMFGSHEVGGSSLDPTQQRTGFEGSRF